MDIDLKVKRTPVGVGGGETVYLDLEDIAVLERAEAAYKRLNTIMDDIKPPDQKRASDDESLTYVAEIIRKANRYAKSAIDEVFDEPIAEKLWGNASCVAFGDTPDNSRFGRAMSALLELYKPAVEDMANKVKEQSDAFTKEVLDEGDGQA